jgi:VanZ family protein
MAFALSQFADIQARFSRRRMIGLALAGVAMVVFALGPFWPPIMSGNDKLFHVAAFGAVGWLLVGAAPERKDWRWAVLLALVFGAIFVEIGQGLIGFGRAATMSDAAASTIGAVAGVVLASWRAPIWAAAAALVALGAAIQYGYVYLWMPVSDILYALS